MQNPIGNDKHKIQKKYLINCSDIRRKSTMNTKNLNAKIKAHIGKGENGKQNNIWNY